MQRQMPCLELSANNKMNRQKNLNKTFKKIQVNQDKDTLVDTNSNHLDQK